VGSISPGVIMDIDIRTLIFLLGVIYLVQVIVFFDQYITNKKYHGIGWWLTWGVSEVFGFAFALLREIPSLRTAGILLQNLLIIAGTIFIYIGIMRFFDRREDRGIIFTVSSLFVVSFLFFLFIIDDIQIRGIIIAATLAAFSFITAHALFVYRPSSVAASAIFAAVTFIANGLFFLLRAVMLFSGASVDMFESNLLNIATFIGGFICSILWTFAFIVMLNQRLNREMEEGISNLQKALEEIKTLKGILPICAHCKKIRNDQGYWQQVENYVSEHSEAEFSHSICPECVKILYPEFINR
jgi:hypothetical protein